MKVITLNYLYKLEASTNMLALFNNTPQLHNIKINKLKKEIILSELMLYLDFLWLIEKTKNILNVTKIIYINKTRRGYDVDTFITKDNKLIVNAQNHHSYVITYDDNNNIISTEHSDGSWMKNTYDEWGNILAITNSNGSATYYTYNDMGKLLNMHYNNSDYYEEYTYDNDGNILTRYDPINKLCNYEYDDMGRLIKIHSPKYWKKYTYNDNVVKIIDSDNYWEELTYNENHELIRYKNSDILNESYNLNNFKIIYG